jgi:PH domain
VLKEGFLYKKGGKRRNWLKRWFKLTPTAIEYYASPKVCPSTGSAVCRRWRIIVVVVVVVVGCRG